MLRASNSTRVSLQALKWTCSVGPFNNVQSSTRLKEENPIIGCQLGKLDKSLDRFCLYLQYNKCAWYFANNLK